MFLWFDWLCGFGGLLMCFCLFALWSEVSAFGWWRGARLFVDDLWMILRWEIGWLLVDNGSFVFISWLLVGMAALVSLSPAEFGWSFRVVCFRTAL